MNEGTATRRIGRRQVPSLTLLAHAPSRTLPLPIFVPMVGLCPFVPRTPNPDHKGTNTIGREVREEIG